MRPMIVLLLLALSGCLDDGDGGGNGDGDGNGGGDGTGTGGPTGGGGNGENETRETVEVTVTWSGAYLIPDQGSYDKTEVRVPANSTVVLTFVNNDPVSDHDLDVAGFDANGAVIGPDESDTITFDVGPPTTTKFYCSVGDHRSNGMEGDFIVE